MLERLSSLATNRNRTNRKRLDCKLGKVLALYPERDGVQRVARLKTTTGEVTRPVQRLHPLEVRREDSLMKKMGEQVAAEENVGYTEKKTRSGRRIKIPSRFMDFSLTSSAVAGQRWEKWRKWKWTWAPSFCFMYVLFVYVVCAAWFALPQGKKKSPLRLTPLVDSFRVCCIVKVIVCNETL